MNLIFPVNYILLKAGMGGCPGILRDPGPGPANPRD